MNKRLVVLELVLLGVGGVLLWLGTQLSRPDLTALGKTLGIIGIGVFLLAAGMQAMITKRLGFETQRPNFGRREMYTGLAAQLWGILFIAFALLVFVFAGIGWLYPDEAEAFWADFLGQPWGWGIALLGIGLTAVVNGIIPLLAGSAGYYQGWADRVERISGVLPLTFGLGLAATGLLLILVPGWTLDRAHTLVASIQQWLFH